MYIFIKTHRTVHIKCVHFLLCEIVSQSFSVVGETETRYKIYNERFKLSLEKNILPVKKNLILKCRTKENMKALSLEASAPAFLRGSLFFPSFMEKAKYIL